MSRTVKFNFRWNWGGDKEIECENDEFLGDVLSKYGINETSTANLILIFKGKIIHPDITISAQKIKDGSTILGLLKLKRSTAKKERFLAFLGQQPSRLEAAREECERVTHIKERAIAQIEDNGYIILEEQMRFCTYVKETQARLEFYRQIEQASEKTVIPTEPKLSDTPLPILIEPDSISSGSILRKGSMRPGPKFGNINLFKKNPD